MTKGQKGMQASAFNATGIGASARQGGRSHRARGVGRLGGKGDEQGSPAAPLPAWTLLTRFGMRAQVPNANTEEASRTTIREIARAGWMTAAEE